MTRMVVGASFLTRLGRDIRGNTIALAAAAMIPLAGLIGGGVDMSRLYLTKTRLQHACDAGALAGRRVMGAGSWTTGGTTSSQARANEIFTTNFRTYAYGTGTLTKSFTESNGTVTGTTTVAVPMTIMRVFGMTSRSLTVNCTAKMEIPNTDVMFVLDVTGSMNCAPGSNCNNSSPVTGAKITGLKSAVKCFYEALLKVNTSEVCGSDPTATTYSGTAQIRIGFMPYSVNVNVGKLLPNDYIANNWAYQSRAANYADPGSVKQVTEWQIWDSENPISQSDCRKYVKNQSPYGNGSTTVNGGGPNPTPTTYTTYNDVGSDDQATEGTEWGWPGADDTSGNNRSCRRERTVATTYYVKTFLDWTYKQVSFNVAGLKAGGSTWNNSVSMPLGTNGANTNVTWDGCIEERQTVKNSDQTPAGEWDTIPNDAYDMNIDMVPNTGNVATQWGPMLEDAVWGRYTGGNNTTADVTTSSNLSRNNSYYCTTEAKKLQTWYTPANFVTYVNSLDPEGNTYHDIGMLWGARFISPTGIFASENAASATGGAIQRHIIFMTDGDTVTGNTNYSAYGIHWWDRRQTTYAPSDTNLENILDTRLAALCTAIKNKNITLWVVSYGGNVNATTEARLSTCATSGKFFSASSTATLISNFKQIASEIAELRLTS